MKPWLLQIIKQVGVFSEIFININKTITAVAVSHSELQNITRRFHSNLLHQTLRPFLVFELGMNLNNSMSLTRNISNEEKKKKEKAQSVFYFKVTKQNRKRVG